MVLFEELQRQGFDGGYDSVRRYVQKWRKREEGKKVEAYIPQTFDSAEAFQFDWSHEMVELGGVVVKMKVAHIRTCSILSLMDTSNVALDVCEYKM